MKTRNAGFTLMELMITLALAAVILSIGAPSFGEFRRNNRLTGVGNEFLGAMQTARTEAIKRQVPVAVCASGNPSAGNAAACSAGAFSGWIAFVDNDNDCDRDAGEALVRVGPTIDPAVTAASTGVCVSFRGNGFVQPIAGVATASNTLFCDDRGTAVQAGTGLSAARGIEVGPTGRSRVTREMAEVTDTAVWPACP